jgi:hypothetical protein
MDGGIFNMTGGTVGVFPKEDGGGNGGSGVGVIGGGTFSMSNGRVWSNNDDGVFIQNDSGVFNMTGGEIGANGGYGVHCNAIPYIKKTGGIVYDKNADAADANLLGKFQYNADNVADSYSSVPIE